MQHIQDPWHFKLGELICILQIEATEGNFLLKHLLLVFVSRFILQDMFDGSHQGGL